MTGVFVFVAFMAAVGGTYAMEELKARRRRSRNLQRDQLGERLAVPAYLRKTLPRSH